MDDDVTNACCCLFLSFSDVRNSVNDLFRIVRNRVDDYVSDFHFSQEKLRT